jgi:hypothetical protein
MIRIEVTGASIPEVADKLIAIGTSLLVSDNDKIARKAARDETQAAIEEARRGETVKSETVEAAIAELNEGPALSFDRDVAPVVLRAVATKGKPFVEAAMAEFSVERASQLDATRWAALIERLESPF